MLFALTAPAIVSHPSFVCLSHVQCGTVYTVASYAMNEAYFSVEKPKNV